MRTIRHNTFETNSSSTHCVTILKAEDYKRWKSNEIFVADGRTVISLEEMQKILQEDKGYTGSANYDEMSEFINNLDYEDCEDLPQSHDMHGDYCDQLEDDITYYTPDGGEKLVILCSYGYE